MTMRNGPPNAREMAPARREDEGMEQGAMLMQGNGRALVRTQTHHVTAMAVQVPRNLKKVEAAVLDEAAMMGQDFFYYWEVTNRKTNKKEPIEGMSIEGAMIMLRNWMNATVDIEVVEETPTAWVFKATFIDFEKGFALPRLFRQRKGEKHGNFDAERAMDIAMQIGTSKAQRNAVDKAMPAWLKRRAMEAAHTAAEGAFTDLKRSAAEAKAEAKRLKIDEKLIERKLGLPIDEFLPKHHVVLAGIYRSINDREITVADAFAVDDVDGETGEVTTPAAQATPAAPATAAMKTGDPKADAQWVPQILKATSFERLDEIKAELIEHFKPDHKVFEIITAKAASLEAARKA